MTVNPEPGHFARVIAQAQRAEELRRAAGAQPACRNLGSLPPPPKLADAFSSMAGAVYQRRHAEADAARARQRPTATSIAPHNHDEEENREREHRR